MHIVEGGCYHLQPLPDQTHPPQRVWIDLIIEVCLSLLPQSGSYNRFKNTPSDYPSNLDIAA